jgi:hypothetical protein
MSTKRVKCPETAPLIVVVKIVPGVHELRYADAMHPDSRAKARGATELQLFIAITDQHNAPLSDVGVRLRFTKNPVIVEFDRSHDGKVATYYARWASTRGQVSPLSRPLSMRICGVRQNI